MKKFLLATLLAGFFATQANAGITIPAGDWTVDVGGNVNSSYTNTTTTGKNVTGAANIILHRY